MDITLILSVVATVAAVVAVMQTGRANRLNRLIVTHQGSLDAPTLSIRFLGHRSPTDFAIALPLTSKRVVVLPLHFDITNSGAKSAKEIQLIMRIPKELLFGGSEMARFETDGAAPWGGACEVVSSSEHLESLLWSLPTLNPGQTARLVLHLSIRDETSFRTEAIVKTRDGVTLTVPYVVNIRWHINYSLFQLDRPPASGAAGFEVVNSHTRTADDALADWRKAHRGERRPTAPRFVLVHVTPDAVTADPALPLDTVRPEDLHFYQIGVSVPRGTDRNA